jgi:hypothetical protein
VESAKNNFFDTHKLRLVISLEMTGKTEKEKEK